MSTKAIALCRVSTARQRLEGSSLQAQELRVYECAQYLDTDIEKIWSLDASSRKGKNVARKDLQEMYDYCRSHKRVRYVIVDEADRFMRSMEEAYWWKVQFKMAGVYLAYANMPEITHEDNPMAVMREMMAFFQAEASNHERITKAKDKMFAKMQAGYYPFNPRPGYRITDIPSLHEPDPERFELIQEALRAVASRESTPQEALRRMTAKGYRTPSGRVMHMARFKEVLSNPFYAGIVQVADWPVATVNGLHKPMITKQEHEAIKQVVSGKKKKFAVNKKNPEYPLNETLCYDCMQENRVQHKLTGYQNHNGKVKDPLKRRYYHRYRCRGCSTYFMRDELHDIISNKLANTVLDDRDLLVQELKNVWRADVYDNRGRIAKLEQRLGIIAQEQSKLAVTLATTDNDVVRGAMEAAIKDKEREKHSTQSEIDLLREIDDGLDGFIDYALSYTERLKTNYWTLEWDDRKRCEQLLFPDGFYITRQKKVYTPKISPIYRDKAMQKEPRKALDVTYGGATGT